MKNRVVRHKTPTLAGDATRIAGYLFSTVIERTPPGQSQAISYISDGLLTSTDVIFTYDLPVTVCLYSTEKEFSKYNRARIRVCHQGKDSNLDETEFFDAKLTIDGTWVVIKDNSAGMWSESEYELESRNGIIVRRTTLV